MSEHSIRLIWFRQESILETTSEQRACCEVYGNYDEGCQQFRHRNGKPQSFCRYLWKECGETNFSHVAYVAQSKRQ